MSRTSSPSLFEVDAVVIGAGVVGLAAARALAMHGWSTVILEQETQPGAHTSSRNSEVIHAGLYYDQGSLKARACLAGKALLYDYLERNGLPHRRCGKLVVATAEDQIAALGNLHDRARDNGVDDTVLLDGDQTRMLEPALETASAGLLSPSTGIIDSHAFMQALLWDAEAHGAQLALRTPVLSGVVLADGRTRLACGGPEAFEIVAPRIVNAAGLWAPRLASRISGFPTAMTPAFHFARGRYATLSGRSPFSRLIYPLPEPGGLGVHLTLDLAGQARFGPDVEWLEAGWLDNPDYRCDPAVADAFESAIRQYWPGLPRRSLQAAYAGVRPKLSGPGEPAADFSLLGPEDHGVAGQVHLFGIESPGLTSSLALAQMTLEALVGAD